MNLTTLQILQENRLPEETINETKKRLMSEGKLLEKPLENSTDIFDEELAIARWKIIQPSCQIEDATPGYFRNTVSKEEVPKLEKIVFLRQQNSRSLFAENDFSGAKVCWSYTGLTPARDQIMIKTGQEPKSSICAKREEGRLTFHCPYAQWRNEVGEPDINGNKPPLCKASISFLGMNLATSMPFWIVFHGTALPIVKDFLRYVRYEQELKKRQGDVLHLYHFKITLGLQLHTTAKGKYYKPVFEEREEITDERELSCVKKSFEALENKFLSEPLDEPGIEG